MMNFNMSTPFYVSLADYFHTREWACPKWLIE